MTDYSISPTLDAAVARCRLGVRVTFAHWGGALDMDAWRISDRGTNNFVFTAAEARAAYLRLVASPSPATLPAGTPADVTAFSPGGS